MKIGKLYLKIFFSFVLILFVTEILITIFFAFLVGGNARKRFAPYIEAHAHVLKALIEERIESAPKVPVGDNQAIRDLIVELSRLYNARVWISSARGETLVSSFSGDEPPVSVRNRKKVSNFYINVTHRRHRPLYISIPFHGQDNEEGLINLLFEPLDQRVLLKPFIAGLAGIGVGIALLLFPVSRLITRPLEDLQVSVQRITRGDLSHRTSTKSKDEIGELVRAFNKMAAQIERMISGTRELTANISHELRSPLARIRVAEELLRDSFARQGKHEYIRHLDTIRDEIEEMDNLIGQVLKLSKLDVQHTSGELKVINLSDIARDLLKKYLPSIQRKSIDLTVEIPEGDVFVSGNEQDMRSALSNIIDNAVKFAPRGGVIDFEMLKNENCTRIALTNSCETDYKVDIERIFEPFFRAKHSAASGSGLGLTITKKVVNNHNGRLEARLGKHQFIVEIFLPADE